MTCCGITVGECLLCALAENMSGWQCDNCAEDWICDRCNHFFEMTDSDYEPDDDALVEDASDEEIQAGVEVVATIGTEPDPEPSPGPLPELEERLRRRDLSRSRSRSCNRNDNRGIGYRRHGYAVRGGRVHQSDQGN